MIYGSWNIRSNRQKFLIFWAIFCPFSPLTIWKIKILTLKKTPGDIIILHICTLHDNHMMYGSWDKEHNDIIFCHSGPFFALLPPMDQENQNFFKNGKSTWRYCPFTSINDSHMMYGSSDMNSNRQNFLTFWTIFCPFTQKLKILKKWKKYLEILSFYTDVT